MTAVTVVARAGALGAGLEEAPDPKSQAEKKQELRKQRRRLQDAGRRRFFAGQSRRPRDRQNRIGNAVARRDARALSWVRHSTAWLW